MRAIRDPKRSSVNENTSVRPATSEINVHPGNLKRTKRKERRGREKWRGRAFEPEYNCAPVYPIGLIASCHTTSMPTREHKKITRTTAWGKRGKAQRAVTQYGPSDLKMTVEPQWTLHISGTNITLSCSAQSVPPAMYYWTLNGTKINQHGPVLHLTESRQNQSGDYSCVAQNNITLRNETQTHTITVIDPVCVHDLGAMDGVPVENMNFSLICHVTGPVDSIQWMKNGTDLYPDDRISLSNHNRTLTFRPVTRSDEGVFRCVAINAVSNSSSPDYTLTVNYGPWQMVISGPEAAESNSTVTFNCSAISHPPSTYSWYFNGYWAADGPVYETEGLSVNSSGQYTCVAHNNVTMASHNASWELTVVEPISSVMVKPSTDLPLDSEELDLFCDVTGPFNRISWMKNGSPLMQSSAVSISPDNTSVSFSSLRTTDDGQYQCVASNVVRDYHSEAYSLLVRYGPTDLVITVELGNPVVLRCKADSQPQSVYQWFFNDTEAGTGSRLPMHKLPVLGSAYTCEARNPDTNVTVSTSYIFTGQSRTPTLQTTPQLQKPQPNITDRTPKS
ncbi:carcinoembryonic antigen-related cell adhesion molecule 5-like [Chanos chanos]|uniref:Carcinoembryonic antigen-related cell adhesion molecule 5-like n=1 Tax=Chanos chanos TaxID=29144 RepID=A0A6J2WB54_CHACN|nr:carcinoembryonic antigen-related cell adhesion molecule 5-like [Chanos chanos]